MSDGDKKKLVISLTEIKEKGSVTPEELKERFKQVGDEINDPNKTILNGVFIIMDSERNIFDGWWVQTEPYTMLGAIENLKRDFIELEIESRKSRLDELGED